MKVTMSYYEKMNGYSNFYWGWGQEGNNTTRDKQTQKHTRRGELGQMDRSIERGAALLCSVAASSVCMSVSLLFVCAHVCAFCVVLVQMMISTIV